MNPTDNKFAPFGADTIKPIQPSKGVDSKFNSYQSTFNTRSPEGLYDIAAASGLRNEADKMVRRSGGEKMEYMSGGFVMDAMDLLNTLSYGVVGLAKGKGFTEGVKNRETLADDDSLGQYGFAGKVAGFVGDILLDPLTYVAPIKIVAKIPGFSKTAEAARMKLFGDLTTIEIDGQKSFYREGGFAPLTFLQDKLVYGAAVDKKFLDGYQSVVGKNDALVSEAEDIIQKMGNLDVDAFRQTLSQGADGRIISTDIRDLGRLNLKPEDMESVREMYQMRDGLMNRLVDLGYLSKTSVDEHWGTYLKQSYDEFLDGKTATHSSGGVSTETKRRVEGLSPEKMKELGQVDNPGVVWATTLLKQIDLVKKSELQKMTANGFALPKESIDEFLNMGGKMEDLHFVPEAKQFTLPGKRADLTNQLRKTQSNIKDILKKRRKAVGDDKELTSAIDKLQSQLDTLKGGTEKNIGEALAGIKQVLREQPSTTKGPMKKAPTSAGQKFVAQPLKKWLNRGTKSDKLARDTVPTSELWKQYKKTPEGLVLERAFEDPRLMYQWSSPVEFLDAIRYPDKATVFKSDTNYISELSEAAQDARIKAAEKQARKFGELEQTKQILEGTNLKLVREAVDKIEQEYADELWEKSGILKALETNKNGQLAGKYVHKEVWNTMKGTFDSEAEFGQGVVMAFKKAKVVWNPASHVRNAFSATIQNWWKMGLGPWRLDTYVDARKELMSKGPAFKEMQEFGFNERSGYIRELMDNYIGNKELLGKSIEKQMGGKNVAKRWFKHVDRIMMNSYAHSDNVAKVAAYKHAVKKGMKKEDAYAQAMAATFNYSEVTPFVHRMRKSIWGVPFITFALKAVPLTAETIAKSPGRISVFGKARNSLFQAAGIEGEQEAEAMPDYMRDDMFVMRLPWKDGDGRSMYFDLSYIVPFGALADGSFLKDPLSANPVLQTVRELSRNETFSGSKVFRESDDIEKVIADITLHTLKLGMPPAVTDFMSDGYSSDGQKRDSKMGVAKWSKTNTDDLGANERSFYQEAFRMAGVSALPYNLTSKESSLAYTQRENLTKMLTENGVLKAFETSYVPKDSPLRVGGPVQADRQTSGGQWTVR